MLKYFQSLLVACALMAVTACASYGPKFTLSSANQVQNGMTREQVIQIMQSRPTSVSDQGKVLVWSYAKANGFTGSVQSRAVKFSFDDDGKAYGIPAGGVYGDTARYQ